MRILAILLVIAAAVVIALFAVGAFESSDVGDAGDPGVQPGPKSPAANGGDDEGPGLAGTSQEPEEAPPIEIHPIDKPLHVLLLARYAERLPAFLAQQWSAGRNVETFAWAPALPEDVEGTDPEALGAFATVLPEPPDASVLEDRSIDVLALHAFDPETLDAAFWQEVLSRVRDGRLGLLLMPGRSEGGALLEQEALKLLSPVATVSEEAGPAGPGVFERRVAFEPTDAGLAHPASRLVAWPRWSRALWEIKASGEHPWGTLLAWPAASVTEGAVTLLEAVPPRGSKVPILIAFEPEKGRVLYFGAYELMGREGYGQPDVVTDYGQVLRNWLAWLAGRV